MPNASHYSRVRCSGHLTEPQKRLLLKLAEEGCYPMSRNEWVPLRRLIEAGFAERHGSSAGRITDAGLSEAARLMGKG